MKKVISFIIAIVAILGVYNTINPSNAIVTSSDLKIKQYKSVDNLLELNFIQRVL